MKQMPDRKKLRREYLRKRRDAYLTGTFYGLIFIPALLVCVLCALIAIGCFVVGIWDRSLSVAMAGMVNGCFAYIIAQFIRSGWTRIKDARAAADLAYVPPVKPDTLPADEILVRGSEEPPVAQSKVLLRAAEEQETAKEELLRVGRE